MLWCVIGMYSKSVWVRLWVLTCDDRRQRWQCWFIRSLMMMIWERANRKVSIFAYTLKKSQTEKLLHDNVERTKYCVNHQVEVFEVNLYVYHSGEEKKIHWIERRRYQQKLDSPKLELKLKAKKYREKKCRINFNHFQLKGFPPTHTQF